MIKQIWIYIATAIVWFTCLGTHAEDLYIRIDDLSPPGKSQYHGVDIEAIELFDRDKQMAWYASEVVDSRLPANSENIKMAAKDVLGQPVIIDWDAPYVYSLNGGWLIVRIGNEALSLDGNLRLSIFEVDGSLFDWGDAPDPYKISIAKSAQGPWLPVGLASGSARFDLEGEKVKPLAKKLDDKTLAEIQAVLAQTPKNQAIATDVKEKMQPSLVRLKALNNYPQLEVELEAIWRFYQYRDHVVNEHKEADNGRVMAPWLLLKTIFDRYQVRHSELKK